MDSIVNPSKRKRTSCRQITNGEHEDEEECDVKTSDDHGSFRPFNESVATARLTSTGTGMATAAPTTDPGKPILLTSSKESRLRVVSALLAFQRWAHMQGRNVPQELSERLQDHVLEPGVANLHLGDVFHLRREARSDSTMAISIFEFTAGNGGRTAAGAMGENTLRVRCVKSWSTDSYTLNMQTGGLHSTIGGSMSGPSNYDSAFDIPIDVPDARTFLLQHLMNPRKWHKEGHLLAVFRPADLPSDVGPTSVSSSNGVMAVCPADPRKPMLIAGLMFKESESQRGCGSPPTRRDELSFIIAERAQRMLRFTGIQKCHADATETGLKFKEGMYEWEHHDVYKYVPGSWM